MIASLATCVVSAGACFWQYNQLSATERQYASLQSGVKPEAQVKQDLAAADAALAADQENTKHLEANVTSASFVPTMLEDLQKFGKDSGLTVTGVRPDLSNPSQTKDAKKPYNQEDITVTATGKYGAILNFIQALSNFPKIVGVQTVSITGNVSTVPTPGQDPSVLQASIVLRAYIFKSPAEQDAANSKPGTVALATLPTQMGGSHNG